MSNIIYNEGLINGQPYQAGDWVKISSHNNKEIKGFFGQNRFLSNFDEVKADQDQVKLDGFGYRSVEAAYQAAKTFGYDSSKIRYVYQSLNAADAKKKSKDLPVRHDWDNIKKDVMFGLVFQKFNCNAFYASKLAKTGGAYLEETNWWEDTFWGYDIKLGGENNLGKILMKVRNILK